MTTFSGTVPTIASGDTTTVPTNLATYRDVLKAATEAWSTFGSASSLTASTTSPVLNNGTWVGRYRQLNKTVDFWIRITIGSTTTVGSGIYQITLPVAPFSGHPCRFIVVYVDSSSGSAYQGVTQFVSGSKLNLLLDSSNAGGVLTAFTNSAPVVPASGDTYDIVGTYETS